MTPDVKRNRGSYAVDAIAITEKSEDQERAALVLDYMKGDVNLNRLLLGESKASIISLMRMEPARHWTMQMVIPGTTGHGRSTVRMSRTKRA